MIDYRSTSTLRSSAPGTFKGTSALREQPWGLSDLSDPTFQKLLGMKRLMQFPGHARVRRRPSHHLSLLRRHWHPLFLQDPRTPTFSSVPYDPRTPCPLRGSPSLASDVLSAFPGALAGHAPVNLRWNPQNLRLRARTLLVPNPTEAPALCRARPRPPRPLGNPRKARAAPASAPGRASMRTIRASRASHTCHHDV